MTTLVIWAVFALVIVLMIPPLRAILGWIFGQLWNGFLSIVNVLTVMFQGILKEVAQAHLIILRNLAPRGVVLPTVKQTDTVRRD